MIYRVVLVLKKVIFISISLVLFGDWRFLVACNRKEEEKADF